MAAGKSKSTGMFDPEALIEAQKRNFQALADAGNIVADGMRSYAERHLAIARDSVAQLWSELQGIGKGKPAAPTDQLTQMRSTFEKVVAQIQELGQHVLDVQSQALAVLNECATKNLEALGHAAPELAELQQKAKQAFEQATHQTSVVIDEMKRRVASIEEMAKAEAAAPAPKPAPVKAEPAPPPPAPKPAAVKPSPAKAAAPKRAPRAASAKPKAT